MKWSGVGYDGQKRYFERLIADGCLVHAYLLAGPDMVGKRTVAEDVARALVPETHTLDIVRLAPDRDTETSKIHDISIEATKALKSWISLRPTGAHKVIIIDDADRLGGEAANNLLKVLEEPPAYAHFFLLTSRPGQVLPTILSRCERVDFLPAPTPKLPASPEVRELGQALKAGIAERLVYAKKLADDAQAAVIVTDALIVIHGELAEKPYLAPVARGLMDLATVLAEPQYNHRLAIEHFLLTCPVQ